MKKEPQTNGNLALEQQNRVIIIPAQDEITARKLRVAAYARVSSSSDDQLNSYRAQNQYYSDLISGNPDWDMVDIYADEGITGTSAEKREDFQRMMQDCRKGKIDRILVKSISRFARNTKDCRAAVRELKELGVSVLFEEQGIDTAQVSSEMVTAIMASLAQKESESISGNVQWGVQKRMQDGTFLPASLPYGYRMVNKSIQINEQQAANVRWIYDAYLNGWNLDEIASEMTERDGTERRWYNTTIRYILTNERYIGDSLWQKSYATNTLPRKQLKNHGERPQFYAKDTHPAMITPEIFETVQKLMAERKKSPRAAYSELSQVLRRKIVCGQCRTPYQRKLIGSMTYWICRQHNRNPEKCKNKAISEIQIQAAFQCLYWKLKHHGEAIFSQMLSNLQKIRYARMLWSEDMVSLNRKISDTLSQIQLLAQLQQKNMVDPDTFISQNNKLSEQLRRWKQEKARLLDTNSDDMVERTHDIMDTLADGPDFLDHFDAELFAALVEKIIVDSNERLRFRLVNGLELTEQIERTRR